MEIVDPTVKIVTYQKDNIDTSDKFPLKNYTSVFTNIVKYLKSSIVYVTHKIESTVLISVIKYGNKDQLSSISNTLVNNNAYLTHNKCMCHREYLIEFFT